MLSRQNDKMILKILFRLITEESSLWASWLKTKYFISEESWQVIPIGKMPLFLKFLLRTGRRLMQDLDGQVSSGGPHTDQWPWRYIWKLCIPPKVAQSSLGVVPDLDLFCQRDSRRHAHILAEQPAVNLAWILWSIWKARCKMQFQKVPSSSRSIVCETKNVADQFLKYCPRHSIIRPLPTTSLAPILAWCDGSFTNAREIAGGVWIIATKTGGVLAAGSFSCLASSVAHVELLALKTVLKELHLRQLTQVTINSDSSQALQLISKGVGLYSHCFYDVLECRDLLRRTGATLQKIPRYGNGCADWLARNARLSASDGFWDGDPPPDILEYIIQDLLFLML